MRYRALATDGQKKMERAGSTEKGSRGCENEGEREQHVSNVSPHESTLEQSPNSNIANNASAGSVRRRNRSGRFSKQLMVLPMTQALHILVLGRRQQQLC